MTKKNENPQVAGETADEAVEQQESGTQAEENKELDELKGQIEKLTEENQKLKETAQRIQAEFDNYRRRALADNEQCKVKASAAVVNAILPGLDSIDEAIKLYGSQEGKNELADGFEKVQKQLLDALGTIGVAAMECEGKDFDPNFHEAVMMQESEDGQSGKVLNVFRKGYTYKESVVRHAQVIVSK